MGGGGGGKLAWWEREIKEVVGVQALDWLVFIWKAHFWVGAGRIVCYP